MSNQKKTGASVGDYDPLDGDFFPSSADTKPITPAKQTVNETELFCKSEPVSIPAKKRGRPAKAKLAEDTTKPQDLQPIKMLLNYAGSRVVTITPSIAEHMLTYCNTLNRKLNKRRVTFLAKAIKKGEWQLNGEAIIFSKDYRLIDGQHRLQAVVAAGKEIESYVTTDIPDEHFVSIDTGHARSGSHVLGIGGKVKNSFDVSATLNKLSRYTNKNFDFDGAHVISNRQLISLLEKYNDVTSSVAFARKFVKGYSKSSIAFCHHCLNKINKELCAKLFEQLASATPTIPLVAALRQGTIKEGRSKARIKQTVVIGSIFKTWNAMRTNDANSEAMITATEEFPIPR
ncbi:MAG: hypothetical protein KAI17_19485 [Thiotrichaceae bacterium]|nr:hypothetical protein [Thiotrichaceae bacterium]